MDVLADRVLELGPKPEASGPYRNFKLTRDADGIAWLLVRPRRRQRQYAVIGRDGRIRYRAGGAGKPAPGRHRHPLGETIRLHRRRRRQRIPRRHRPARRGDADRPRARGDRPAGSLEDSDRRRDSRLLPRRRARSRAGLPVAHRHRRRALRLSGSDARPASRPRRHRALHASGQSDAGDDVDADRQDHRRAQSQIARPGRCGDAGAPRPQRRQGRGVRPAETRKTRPAECDPEFRAGARLARLANARRGREGRAARALSRALCADRAVGKARRRQAPRCWRRRSVPSPI